MLHRILVTAGLVAAVLLAGKFYSPAAAHAQALPDSALYAQSGVRSGPHSATRPAGSSSPTQPAGSREPTRPAGSSEPTPPAGGAGRSGSVRTRSAPVDPWAGYVERNAFGTPLERPPVKRPTRTVEERELQELDPRGRSRLSEAEEESVSDPTQGNPWATQASEAIRNPALPGARRDPGPATGEAADSGAAEFEPFGMRSPEYRSENAGESEWSGQAPYGSGGDASGDRPWSSEGDPALAPGETRTRSAPQVETYLPEWEPIR